jgi:hypothetical protein
MSTTVRVVVYARWTACRALRWSMRMSGTRWLPSVAGTSGCRWCTELNLLQRGGVNQYWTWRGDLAATASVGEPVQPAPVFDAFGDYGERQP